MFSESNPIPPLTLLRLKKLWPHARRQGHEIGENRRVGYYRKQDGLDCIWLVDDHGDYDWTADHNWVADKFEIIELSNEDDLHGVDREQIGPRINTQPVAGGDATRWRS